MSSAGSTLSSTVPLSQASEESSFLNSKVFKQYIEAGKGERSVLSELASSEAPPLTDPSLLYPPLPLCFGLSPRRVP